MPRVLQFGQELEKELASGKGLEESLETATQKAKTIPPKRKRRSFLAKLLVKKFRKLKTGLRELKGGSKTYLYETPEERRKRVELERG
jgi:hypothetical protein